MEINVIFNTIITKIYNVFFQAKTERVVNIVRILEEKSLEGHSTNSVFRVLNYRHEMHLLKLQRHNEFVIETTVAVATPLSCPLNKFIHQHGCYSVS